MKSSTIEDLVDHIQAIVQPTDDPPETNEQHPRQPPPWWVSESWNNVSERPRIALDDELILEDSLESSEFNNAIKEVAKNPNPDVYAYYCPFHFYRNSWGIYIKASGILAISAFVLKKKRLGPVNSTLINSVFRLLLHHECFHYWTELACSRYEVPLIDFQRLSGSHYCPYKSYFYGIKASEHEEAMANANALRQVKKYHAHLTLPSSASSAIQSYLSRFMESQPPGYRDFADFLVEPDHKRGKDQVLSNIREIVHLSTGTSPYVSQVPGRHFFSDRQIAPCPIYLIQDGLSSALSTARPFPVLNGMRILVHTREHNPPHFHLESPIGEEMGKYEWPNLNPLKGEKELSGSEKKKLETYLKVYRSKIDRKIRSVFG